MQNIEESNHEISNEGQDKLWQSGGKYSSFIFSPPVRANSISNFYKLCSFSLSCALLNRDYDRQNGTKMRKENA